jgi:hypothetical protein
MRRATLSFDESVQGGRAFLNVNFALGRRGAVGGTLLLWYFCNSAEESNWEFTMAVFWQSVGLTEGAQ